MNSLRKWFPFLPVLLVALPLAAQDGARRGPVDPISWTLSVEPAEAAPGATVAARFAATIEEGWHLYSMTNPPGGGIPSQIGLVDNPVVDSWKIYQPTPEVVFDPNFQADSESFEHEAVFLFEIVVASDATGPLELTASARYQACSDSVCLRPKKKTATAEVQLSAGGATGGFALPANYAQTGGSDGAAPQVSTAAPAPATPPDAETPAGSSGEDQGLVQFAGVAFGFGLLAIFTPCVFPMIPITMSYFVSTQSGTKKASLGQAITFCVGVVVLFTGMGALVSALLGPFGLQQIGSSPWVNGFIALIFIAFAFSLFGAFEITVPSGALTSLNKISDRGGLLGTLVMGLVFALASFACTGPFVGALLAGSLSGGGWVWPAFGMFMFSAGLALPFFFLALFPAYLSKMPKGGGWLSVTKITMGFVILAAALKYLSNVDLMLGWELLLRERYLAIWVVLFATAGLYLMKVVRIGFDDDSPIGVGRLAAGVTFLGIALSLIPGMFGARLGDLEAYVPSREYSGWTGVLASAEGAGGGSRWMKDDFEGALAKAKAENKRVLISFTGYACTNCHWMKEVMFVRPEIAATLDDLILVELYTDGTGDQVEFNQNLQEERFRSVAIPFYALLGPDGETIEVFEGRTGDTGRFRAFLDSSPSTVSAQAW